MPEQPPDTPLRPGDVVIRRFGLTAAQAGDLGRVVGPDSAPPTADHVRVRWDSGVTAWKLPSQLVRADDPAQARTDAAGREASARAALHSLADVTTRRTA